MLKYAQWTLQLGYNIGKGRGRWNVNIGDWKTNSFHKTGLFRRVSQALLSRIASWIKSYFFLTFPWSWRPCLECSKSAKLLCRPMYCIVISNPLSILLKKEVEREAICISPFHNYVLFHMFFPQRCEKCPHRLAIGSSLIKCNICKLLDYK